MPSLAKAGHSPAATAADSSAKKTPQKASRRPPRPPVRIFKAWKTSTRYVDTCIPYRPHQLGRGIFEQFDCLGMILLRRGSLGSLTQFLRLANEALDLLVERSIGRALLLDQHLDQHQVRVVAVDFVLVFLFLAGKVQRADQRVATAQGADAGLGHQIGAIEFGTAFLVLAGLGLASRFGDRFFNLADGFIDGLRGTALFAGNPLVGAEQRIDA